MVIGLKSQLVTKFETRMQLGKLRKGAKKKSNFNSVAVIFVQQPAAILKRILLVARRYVGREWIVVTIVKESELIYR